VLLAKDHREPRAFERFALAGVSESVGNGDGGGEEHPQRPEDRDQGEGEKEKVGQVEHGVARLRQIAQAILPRARWRRCGNSLAIDSVAGIAPAATTDEARAATIAKYDYTEDSDVALTRYSGAEWSVPSFGWEHFQDSYHAIMNMDREEDFGQFRERVLELMIAVLSELDDEGFYRTV
jgi:hypothetical protein